MEAAQQLEHIAGTAAATDVAPAASAAGAATVAGAADSTDASAAADAAHAANGPDAARAAGAAAAAAAERKAPRPPGSKRTVAMHIGYIGTNFSGKWLQAGSGCQQEAGSGYKIRQGAAAGRKW